MNINRNELCFEKFESELPLRKVSQSSQNNRAESRVAKDSTTFIPRKLMTQEASGHEQMLPEQIATKIRRMDTTARQKIIAQILNVDELTLKQIATKLRGADVKKLENKWKDENAGSDEGTAVKALTIHMPMKEHHDKVAKLALETLNNPDNQSKKRNETPDGHIKIHEKEELTQSSTKSTKKYQKWNDTSHCKRLTKDCLRKPQSPLLCSEEKGKSQRLRHKSIHRVTTWSMHTILLISDILDQLTGKTPFTAFDICQADNVTHSHRHSRKQHQIMIDTPRGPSELTTEPSRWTDSPIVSERMTNHVSHSMFRNNPTKLTTDTSNYVQHQLFHNLDVDERVPDLTTGDRYSPTLDEFVVPLEFLNLNVQLLRFQEKHRPKPLQQYTPANTGKGCLTIFDTQSPFV
ncbi:hypothetical protein H4582DRAFT_2054142 [Lactarius indigo]|nr:hypothetical protein H4582DRAFT_2054142 [Lactarius indigo]